jgi:DHA1 family bicyclomycin/chloramphenicol resistance-like MFS transporter
VRIGMARLMTAGIALQAVAALAGFALARGGVWHPAALFLPWTVIGFGQGLALPNLTASAVALAPRHAGTASGLLGFGQQFLGAVAVQAMAVTSTATPVPVTSFVAAAATVALAAHLAARAAGRQTAAPAPG